MAPGSVVLAPMLLNISGRLEDQNIILKKGKNLLIRERIILTRPSKKNLVVSRPDLSPIGGGRLLLFTIFAIFLYSICW